MRVIRTMTYQGTTIYVLQHYVMWQYFFNWEGKFYMQYAYAWPDIKSLLFSLSNKSLYNKSKLDDAERSMLAGATASIDELIKQDGKNKKSVPGH